MWTYLTQDMDELAARARTLIFTKAGQLLQYSEDPYLTVVLDLPCSFFMVKAVRYCGWKIFWHVVFYASAFRPHTLRYNKHSKIRLIEEVARSLEWAPSLKHLANLVIDSLSSNGKSGFNALHLRVEKDAEVWADIMGGKDVCVCWLAGRAWLIKIVALQCNSPQVVWNAYVEAMTKAKFDSDTPLYVASALLTYNARGGMLLMLFPEYNVILPQHKTCTRFAEDCGQAQGRWFLQRGAFQGNVHPQKGAARCGFDC